MKVALVGEAAEHEADLRAHLDVPCDVVGLPMDAANTAQHDEAVDAGDVVVSLRFSRPAGKAPPFALLQVPGAGLDGIDQDALAPVTSVSNVYEHEIPIAEYVLARLLEWEIRADSMQASFGPDAWPALYRHRVPHGEVYGKTLGLVGYGRIGRAIAARAAAFGVHVVAVDATATGDETAEVLPPARLTELLASADYLVVACPLTQETAGLIDRAALRLLPNHAVLVNVSRAPVVDEDALYDALGSGEIGGAILDVWYRYPHSPDDQVPPATRPLWELPNTWCTPHSCAWTSALSKRRYAVVAENVNRLRSGRPLLNLVRAGTAS